MGWVPRSHVAIRAGELKSLLADDHRARLVLDFVGGSGLPVVYAGIGSRERGAGRTAMAPAV